MKKSDTLNVVLCGPGDVAKEVGIAREVISDWNQRNWEVTNCGLKAHHWDTDAVPSMEARGQEVINRQIIDKADLLVAIFWRRLGTPTGMHESGTAEEVDRATARGAEVMLYFSDIEAPLAKVDEIQWNQLQAYRSKAENTGLVWRFRSRDEFRNKFGDHLHKKVHELLARMPKPKANPTKPKPSVSLKATGTTNVQMVGNQNTVNVKVPRDSRGKSARDLPGTIGADPDMRSYAQYLVDKYIKCRLEGEKQVQQYKRPFSAASAHCILGQGFGVTNSVYQIPQPKFLEWVASAQAKIRRTVFAKRLGHDIFHSWEEHLRQRGVGQ